MTSGRAHARFLQWLEEFYTKCFDEDEVLRYAELGKARQVLSVALMHAIAQQHEDTMRQIQRGHEFLQSRSAPTRGGFCTAQCSGSGFERPDAALD